MKRFIFTIAFLLCFSMCSCSFSERSADDILERLMIRCVSLPEGEIFGSDAEEGEDGFLPPTVRNAMYGEDCAEYFSLIEEYSIYLSSFASPYEIAVFKCYSGSDGLKIERMCRERKDIVGVALRDTSFYELYDDIRVVREGKYVIFIMCDAPDSLVRLARQII